MTALRGGWKQDERGGELNSEDKSSLSSVCVCVLPVLLSLQQFPVCIDLHV